MTTQQRSVKTAVVLVAPEDQARALYPVVDVEGRFSTLVVAAVQEAASAGVSEIVLVCGDGLGNELRRQFWPATAAERERMIEGERAESDRRAELGRKLRCVELGRWSGTAAIDHAVERAGGPVLVLEASRFYLSDKQAGCGRQLIEAHARSGGRLEAVGCVESHRADVSSLVRGAPVAGEQGLFLIDECRNAAAGSGLDESQWRSPGAPLGGFLATLGMRIEDGSEDDARAALIDGSSVGFATAEQFADAQRTLSSLGEPRQGQLRRAA